MKFSDLVTLYFERFNAEQTLWGIYITIVLGTLAFFGALKPSRKTKQVAVLLSIGFFTFAVVNAMALGYVVHVRSHIYKIVQEYQAHDSDENQAIIEQVKPTVTKLYPIWELLLFHGSADAMVLVAIWRLSRQGKECQSEPSDS